MRLLVRNPAKQPGPRFCSNSCRARIINVRDGPWPRHVRSAPKKGQSGGRQCGGSPAQAARNVSGSEILTRGRKPSRTPTGCSTRFERRGVGDREKHTVERYLQRWLATLTDRNEHSPTTLSAYRRHIEVASRYIGGIALEKLSPADLDGLYATLLKHGGVARKAGAKHGRPLNPRSVLHVHRVLHTALERARKWKLIGENPARDASAPSVRKSSVRAFYQDEVDRLLAAAATNRETHTIVATLLITGIRRSELLGLAWDAIDLDQGSLTIKRVSASTTPRCCATSPNRELGADAQHPAAAGRTAPDPEGACPGERADLGQGLSHEPMFVFPRPDGEPRADPDRDDRPAAPGDAPGPGSRDAGLPTHGGTPLPPCWSAPAATSRRCAAGLGRSSPVIPREPLRASPLQEHDAACSGASAQDLDRDARTESEQILLRGQRRGRRER